MRSEPTAQIAHDLGRDYEAVLNFVHKVQDVSGEIDGFELYDACETVEIYVMTGEKGIEDEDESPRERGLKKGTRTVRIRQTPGIDTRPSGRRMSSVSRLQGSPRR